MAENNSRRYYGEVGFFITNETEPGVYEEQFVRRMYRGDVKYDAVKNGSTDKRVSDVDINVKIEILADQYARENMGNIRYAIFNGIKWRVSSYEPLYPRLILTLGGEYND